MVVAESLGPLSSIFIILAETLHRALSSVGLPTPPAPLLPDAILFSLITFLFSFIVLNVIPSLFSRDSRDSILIIGVSGEDDAPAVGKTTLFHTLRYGQAPKLGTVPSQATNADTFSPSQAPELRPVRWVDFPGHPRLRHGLTAELSRARAIILVVDAERFAAQARRDAVLLHDVLTRPSIAREGTPLLVWLNRRANVPLQVARTRLEAELQRARAAAAANGALRSAAVGEDEDDADAERVPLGFENEAFTFDHAPGPVTFGAGCAISGEVDDVVSFAREALV